MRGTADRPQRSPLGVAATSASVWGAAPRLSVLVAAHKRTRYLRRAVESAFDQRPDEVLVVKYSRDPEIDAALETRGAIVVPTRERFQGGKFADGIGRATGDVVVFLDDDDLFLPGKLDRIREVFDDPGVVFYANRYATFSEENEPLARIEPVRRFRTVEGDQFWAGLRPEPSSCLAARRAELLPWLNDLRRLTVADHAMLMMAVTTGRTVAIDSSILTGYRVASAPGGARTFRSIWSDREASPLPDIRWMLDLVDAQSGGIRETLVPMVVNAIVHLVFLAEETRFREYRRTIRLVLHGVGVRRPLVVPTLLLFAYPLAPSAAVHLGRAWREFVGHRSSPGGSGWET